MLSFGSELQAENSRARVARKETTVNNLILVIMVGLVFTNSSNFTIFLFPSKILVKLIVPFSWGFGADFAIHESLGIDVSDPICSPVLKPSFNDHQNSMFEHWF